MCELFVVCCLLLFGTHLLFPVCQGAGEGCKVSRALGSKSESCLTQAEPEHSERVLLNMDQVKVSCVADAKDSQKAHSTQLMM